MTEYRRATTGADTSTKACELKAFRAALEARERLMRLVMVSVLAIAGLVAAIAVAQAGPTMVVEAKSGRVLHQSGAHEPWYPASLTKMMTTYVMLDQVAQGRATMDTPITMSVSASRQPPSKIGLKPGTQVRLEDAIKIIMVKSANDLSHAIAESLGGSVEGFADMMNRTARRIGMTNSNFVNPHGLPNSRQITTAHDMAVLARALYNDFGDYDRFFRLPHVTVGSKTYKNYNGLIGQYPGADGMKTGYTCASGFNLVASASRRGRRVIAVVLGASTARQREAVAASLLEKGFSKGFFSFTAPRIDRLPVRRTSATPGDMRPYTCSRPRRWTPAEQDEQVASLFGTDIDVDRGRRAMKTNTIARARRPVTAGLGSALLPVKAFSGRQVATSYAVPAPIARPLGLPSSAAMQAFAPVEPSASVTPAAQATIAQIAPMQDVVEASASFTLGVIPPARPR